MNDIRKLLVNEKIIFSDDLGIDSSFLESAAFAYIGIRTLKILTAACPETTGCSKGNICGKLITNTN